MPSKNTLTVEQREQRRAGDRERLKQAAEQLLSSDGWRRWVIARGRNGLARYSLSNLCLIVLARPEATFVAGFRAWLDLGYCVRKGEKAIRIFAPMPIRERNPHTGERSGERTVLFRSVSVFDRDQVTPLEGVEPAPLEPPTQPLAGDSHRHLLVPLAAFAETLGFAVCFEEIPGGAGGFCDARAKRISVDVAGPANAQVRTLVHEIAHAMGVDYNKYSREQAEVIVDTVTFVVCCGVGLEVGGESIPYVAGWGEAGALEAVTEFAGLIDRLARRLEEAVGARVEAVE